MSKDIFSWVGLMIVAVILGVLICILVPCTTSLAQDLFSITAESDIDNESSEINVVSNNTGEAKENTNGNTTKIGNESDVFDDVGVGTVESEASSEKSKKEFKDYSPFEKYTIIFAVAFCGSTFGILCLDYL